MIDKATVQKIKETADIVEVVSDYVHLVRRGANYMGLCPFHNERTPSFSVNKARNFCYCFSCKKGGSPVNFIMEKEGLTYHEALLHLARKYGIKVEERELTDEEREAQSAREAMLVANEWAMHLMEHDLTDSDEGRDIGLQYLTQRGVTDRAIRAFHLGYAIDRGNHLLTEATKAGFKPEVLKELGLVGSSAQGNLYDRFRGRVIFPILNTSGKVIAFGGRDLKGGLAKYVNSPESALYKKSNELYGIYQARNAIVKEGKCFLVEGYMDVIGMWQSGMENVVASSGTALTDGQIALIHRFTDRITLIYDGDSAGVKAALRGIDMLLGHKLKVSVLRLPPEEDPDSFARKHTPEEFRKYVEENETDIIRFKARVLLEESGGSPQGRIGAVNSVVESIAHIPDPVSRDIYIQECARLLGVAGETVAKATAQARARLTEQWKREREYKRIREMNGGATGTQVTTPLSAPLPNGPAPAAIGRPSPPPLQPLEMAVVRYCIRYAYLPFCQASEESDETINVLEFVKSEMEISSMEFSCPNYAKIFRLLIDSTPDFEESYARHLSDIETEIEKGRRERIEEIASKSLTVSEIRKEETIMEQELAEKRDTMIKDFIKGFSMNLLCSHEDNDVRRISTALLQEPHKLSNIYSRQQTYTPEDENLAQLLPRAIEEWKAEILNLRLQELLDRFREITAQGKREEEEEIQCQITNLMRTRSELARSIGERVIRKK